MAREWYETNRKWYKVVGYETTRKQYTAVGYETTKGTKRLVICLSDDLSKGDITCDKESFVMEMKSTMKQIITQITRQHMMYIPETYLLVDRNNLLCS